MRLCRNGHAGLDPVTLCCRCEWMLSYQQSETIKPCRCCCGYLQMLSQAVDEFWSRGLWKMIKGGPLGAQINQLKSKPGCCLHAL